jgi:hypothetical protein
MHGFAKDKRERERALRRTTGPTASDGISEGAAALA